MHLSMTCPKISSTNKERTLRRLMHLNLKRSHQVTTDEQMLYNLEMNEMQNLQGTVLVNVVDGNDVIAKNKTSSEAGTCSNNEAVITDILMKLEAEDESKVKFSLHWLTR
ncbi:hypothetical protein J1N35_029004 [Gossypium stocksii]|uniref:Uncharacterized protein n=1 Tax=Gossypium stocksii TaxID=47602 RepID=A0A9D3UY34_9ROSI|nr:hypothetical protein J1N35_029004 [Gossypium stocksii]